MNQTTRIRIHLLAIAVYCFCSFHITVSQEMLEKENLNTKAWIKRESGRKDTSVVLRYYIPKRAHVDIRVGHRIGEIFASPVYSEQDSGEYLIKFSSALLPEGSYDTEMVLNHIRQSAPQSVFIKVNAGHVVTSSREEDYLLNQAMTMAGSNPERSAALFDSLLTYFPNYVDRGAVFLNSIPAYAKVADSTKLFAIIDSAIGSVPHSSVYRFISVNLCFQGRFLETALNFAERAVAHVNDVPLPFRKSYLMFDQYALARAYFKLHRDKDAEDTFLRCLSTLYDLPSYDRWAGVGLDIQIFESLGMLKERMKDYASSIEYYRKGLAIEPHSDELWMGIQRAYLSKRGSEEGFPLFKKDILASMPLNQHEFLEPDTIVGKTFPPFRLKTLEGREIKSSDLKGKIKVLNFWAFWCGNCFEERPVLDKIARDFAGRGVEVVGIHYSIGEMGYLEDDTKSIRKVMNQYPTNFPTVFLTSGMRFGADLGVNAVPTTIIVDRKGVIRHKEVGYEKYRTEDRLRNKIEEILAE